MPGWIRMVPLGAVERTGSGIMQRVLDSMVLYAGIQQLLFLVLTAACARRWRWRCRAGCAWCR